MRITVFTGNQSRHLALIQGLSSVATEVFAVQECTTVFPGRVDDFYRKSEVMQRYFAQVINAEKQVFGDLHFSEPNVRSLSLRAGDLDHLDIRQLECALKSDVYVVFGASWIRVPLIDALIERGAVNIHMGVSPFYRGSSCNFWALYDGHADLVGATIHRLSRGLDSGGILFHALPAREPTACFLIGMKAVKAAQVSLINAIARGELNSIAPVQQDRSLEIRYSRNAEFTDEVAAAFISRNLTPAEIGVRLKNAPARDFVRPRFV